MFCYLYMLLAALLVICDCETNLTKECDDDCGTNLTKECDDDCGTNLTKECDDDCVTNLTKEREDDCRTNITKECEDNRSSFDMSLAMIMIEKFKESYTVCPTKRDTYLSIKPMDCEEVLKTGYNENGSYKIWPRNRIMEDKSLDVYCDMDTDDGGWTVIQRRGNFFRPVDYFYKDWASYKSGFGDIERDFWLGNDFIHALTNQALYSVRFDLKDVAGGKAYALYDIIWVDNEDENYTLHIMGYSGDAGDSMAPHNNVPFSTKDVKNDDNKEENCARRYKGGWWYRLCHQSNLNGLYLRGKHDSFADGVNWNSWRGFFESADTTEIKIRRKNFRKQISSDLIEL